MKEVDICTYAETFPAAHTDYKLEWGATRLLLDDKMFGMLGQDKSGKRILTVKLKPEDGELLREQYAEIVPGYYMNKVHWNSIDLAGQVPDETIKAMIQNAYQLILQGMTKKRQREINELVPDSTIS
ncbi:MAG: MmcQ/YjbR family DNA-binding protein [Pseudolactococcus laudensis]